jgi:hypothetical protein
MAIMINAKIRESPTIFKKDLDLALMALLERFKPIA